MNYLLLTYKLQKNLQKYAKHADKYVERLPVCIPCESIRALSTTKFHVRVMIWMFL